LPGGGRDDGYCGALIDLGKNSWSVAGVDETGRVVLRRKTSRDGLARLLAAVHDGDGSVLRRHCVGRPAESQGYRVRLMPPEYVRPYVNAQKKESAQFDVQAFHRVRERLVAERTA
jgi:hypothetical protein